ncbi:MAG: hypothetical protein KA135_11125 [Halioglobus sp.]|nr:hypothetical protein [Halioglobus sp.]
MYCLRSARGARVEAFIEAFVEATSEVCAEARRMPPSRAAGRNSKMS